MTRIAVFNQKGGVGKTTTVLNLSAAMARDSQRCVLIDMDPQSHLTHIHLKTPQPIKHDLFDFYQDHLPLKQLLLEWNGLGHLIPASKELIKVDSIFGKGPSILNRLKQGLETMERELSITHTMIDCCPYLGVLSLNAVFAADVMIIPIASDFLSLQGAQKVEHTLRALEPVLKKRVERRYLLTSYDRRRGMTFEVENKARALFKEDVFTTVISENVAIAESPHYHLDVFSYQHSSTGAQDYKSLYLEIKDQGLMTTNAYLQ